MLKLGNSCANAKSYTMSQQKKKKEKILNSMKMLNIYTISPKKFFNAWKKSNGSDSIKAMISNVDWIKMSMYYELPENFLLEFSEYIHWIYAYKYQNLSMRLLETTGEDITKWDIIVKFQDLTEDFMNKFQNKLKFNLVWLHQKYSEEFIKKHIDKVDWDIVSYRIKITDPQLKPFVKKENNWLYMSEETKVSLISRHYTINIIEGKKYIECYKAVRSDYSSIYAPHLRFDKREHIYETVCDYNYNNFNSYGFGCWTFEEAKNFAQNKKIHNFKILKILTPLDSCCWTGNFRSNINFPNISYSHFVYKQQYGYVGKLRTSEFRVINFDVPLFSERHVSFYI